MRLAILLSVPVLSASFLGAQDLTLVSKHTRGGSSTTETSYFTAKKVRMGTGDGNEFIFDVVTGTITVVNNGDKQYYVLTPQEMETVSAQAREQVKRMEAQMASLPAAFREKSNAVPPPTIDVQRGTGTRTIAGFACDNWVVRFGEVKQETCLSTALPIPPTAYDAQKRFAAGMHAMAGSMGTSMAGLWDKLKELSGYPLATTSTMRFPGGKPQAVGSEVTEVKKGAVPATAFDVPATYKKLDSPLAKMAAAGGGPAGAPGSPATAPVAAPATTGGGPADGPGVTPPQDKK
jgi:hypothetical protein